MNEKQRLALELTGKQLQILKDLLEGMNCSNPIDQLVILTTSHCLADVYILLEEAVKNDKSVTPLDIIKEFMKTITRHIEHFERLEAI